MYCIIYIEITFLNRGVRNREISGLARLVGWYLGVRRGGIGTGTMGSWHYRVLKHE